MKITIEMRVTTETSDGNGRGCSRTSTYHGGDNPVYEAAEVREAMSDFAANEMPDIANAFEIPRHTMGHGQ